MCVQHRACLLMEVPEKLRPSMKRFEAVPAGGQAMQCMCSGRIILLILNRRISLSRLAVCRVHFTYVHIDCMVARKTNSTYRATAPKLQDLRYLYRSCRGGSCGVLAKTGKHYVPPLVDPERLQMSHCLSAKRHPLLCACPQLLQWVQ